MARVRGSLYRGSLYRATVLDIVEDGTDARRNRRWAITVKARALDGTDREVTVRTRGYMAADVVVIDPGHLVNVIRDGNGSAIHIEKTGA